MAALFPVEEEEEEFAALAPIAMSALMDGFPCETKLPSMDMKAVEKSGP